MPSACASFAGVISTEIPMSNTIRPPHANVLGGLRAVKKTPLMIAAHRARPSTHLARGLPRAAPSACRPDRTGEAPVVPCPVRSPGGARRRAGAVQLSCRLRIGTGRPWTVREARRPPAGPARPDRHGSIRLDILWPGRDETRRRGSQMSETQIRKHHSNQDLDQRLTVKRLSAPASGLGEAAPRAGALRALRSRSAAPPAAPPPAPRARRATGASRP